jgi:hypothetical protein
MPNSKSINRNAKYPLPSGDLFPLVILFDSLACTYVQRIDTSLMSDSFGFLDDLLLGALGTGFSRLEDVVGKIKAGSQVKTHPQRNEL